MFNNKKMLKIALGLVALTMSSNLVASENNERPVIKFIENEFDLEKEANDMIKEREGGEIDRLSDITQDNFIVENIDYLYNGEEIYTDQKLSTNVSIVKLFAKKPIFIFEEGSKKFDTVKEIPDKIRIEEVMGSDLFPDDKEKADKKYKKVTLLEDNQKYLHVQIRDNITGETKDIALPKRVYIKNIDTNIENGIRYKDLVDKSNSRIKYSINSIDDAYEPYENSKIQYADEDDYVGLKTVKVNVKVDGAKNRVVNREVLFGTSLDDFKDRYEDLLTNAHHIKFGENGELLNGFNPDEVEKITKFNEATDNKNIEFVTEILDKDKHTVGLHNIARKIIVDGKVVFEKREKAFVNFKGITVGIIDRSFYDTYPELEDRIYRVTPKENDIIEKPNFTTESSFREQLQGLNRSHGTTSIASMIDQISTGGGIYPYAKIGETLAKAAREGLIERFGVNTFYEFNEKILGKMANAITAKVATANASKLQTKIRKDVNDKISFPLVLMGFQKLADYKEDQSNMPESLKEEILKEYEKIEEVFKEIANITEKEKLESTDLYFATMSAGVGDGGSINPFKGTKSLSNFLDENKHVKFINMSYGNDYSAEEYEKLSKMTDAEKEKAAEAFNTNPEYRVAILSWLKSIKLKLKEVYSNGGNMETDLSLYDYFESKKEITKDDFDKLIKSKLSVYKDVFNSAFEIALADKDVVFVRAHGNSYIGAQVDLTDFDENGNKIVYQDPNMKFNNGFSSLPTIIEEDSKEKDRISGKKHKYNYSIRKNLISVVGLAPKAYPVGAEATDELGTDLGLFTTTFNLKRLKAYGEGMLQEYNELVEKINEYKKDPSKYSKEYIDDLKARIKVVNDMAAAHDNPSDKTSKFSFSRAGKSKLWTIAAEGMYIYTKRLTDEEKKFNAEDSKDSEFASKLEVGSSFAAPRVSAVAARINEKFPWMTAHQVKQLIFTNANDGYLIETNITDEFISGDKTKRGLYGVDEVIGWGVLDGDSAYKGPRRFVKALTHETGDENFIANIPYGTFTFEQGIRGGFDPALHANSRGKLEDKYALAYFATKLYTDDEIRKYDNIEELIKDSKVKVNIKNYTKYLKDNNITPEIIVDEIRPKVNEYISALPFEERELFEDAGLVKRGNGTLIIAGDNTFKEATNIEEGTLIAKGTFIGDVNVEKNAKLKLALGDGFFFKFNLNNLNNKGKVYSYSDLDEIKGTYKPYIDSETRVATKSLLKIHNLDLSEIPYFDISIFRNTGMKLLPDGKTEKEIVEIENVSKEDVNKITDGEENLSALLKLVVEKKDNDIDGKKVSFKIVRKDPETTPEVLAGLRDKVAESSSEDAAEDGAILDLFSTEEAKTLNGDILTNSMLIGFDIANTRNRILKDTMTNTVGLNNRFSIFSNVLTDLRIRKNNDKNILSDVYGINLGAIYKTKYDKVLLSFDFTTSKLKDVKVRDASNYNREENKFDKNQRVDAEVRINGYSISLANEVNYKNVYLKTVLAGQYLSKYVSRTVGNNGVNTSSSDFVFNFNNELGYDYNYKINDKYTLNVVPYVGLDFISYTKGSFEENEDFGYKGKAETFNKTNMTLGTKLGITISNRLDLGVFADYTKYLSNTELKTKGEVEKYRYSREIKGVSLDDNVVNFGANINYRVTKKLNLGLSYKNKNLKDNLINASIKYEF